MWIVSCINCKERGVLTLGDGGSRHKLSEDSDALASCPRVEVMDLRGNEPTYNASKACFAHTSVMMDSLHRSIWLVQLHLATHLLF